MLNWRADCVIYDATREPKFAVTGIKLTFSSNFINSRKCKAFKTTKIRISTIHQLE